MIARFAQMTLPVVGMVHLPPLPGSPRYGGSLAAVRDAMLADADALVSGGVDGLMLENFGDAPFYPGCVPVHVVSQMTALAAELRRHFDLPLGINVLRNDGRAALAIAHAVGAVFIRVNVLCGARMTDQGIIQGIAHDLLRDRAMLGADGVKIMADVNVKHSAALADQPLEQEVADAIARGGADAVIVTGAGTGKATDLGELDTARQAAEVVRGTSSPVGVWVGSGVSEQNVAMLRGRASGVIAGSAFKVGGQPTGRVDAQRVRRFMQAVQALDTA